MIETKDKLPLSETFKLEARARQVIGCVTQTASRRPNGFAPGQFPTYIERGQGAHVWDVDGNEYIDCFMACGPALLGYCYPAVDRAIAEQLARGIIFSRATAREVEVAEILTEMIPCAETVRFLKGGAEAKVKDLTLSSVEVLPGAQDGEFTVKADWIVNGSVGHWGHIHKRSNRYLAQLTIAVDGGRWKLQQMNVLQAERL